MTRFVFFFCCLLWFYGTGFSQVKDDTPAESKQTATKGFFSAGIGRSAIGFTYSSIAYSHRVGKGYLGLEFGSYSGDDGTYLYKYTPIVLSYTAVSKPRGKGWYLGYASIKVGTGKFKSAELLDPNITSFLPPNEDNIGLFGLNGGVQLRITNHVFVNLEAGLSNMYSYLFGITVKL